jgi:exopolyphosphatase/pppGpp-phosphohydrolase
VVIDIGGGSTELITESFRTSLDIGSVRLTERFGADLGAAAGYVASLLPDIRADRLLGVDGTTAEVVAFHGRSIATPSDVDEMIEWLVRSDQDARRARLLEPDRSETLAAGAVVLREALRHLGAGFVEQSPRDLLTGAALEAAALPEPDEGAAPPGAYTCC